MSDVNLLTVFIEPLSEAGLASLRDLKNSDLLIVGAVGKTGKGEYDLGVAAGIGPIGFPVESESRLADILDRTEADLVVDCSGKIAWTAPLLKICLRRGIPALIWAPPGGFDDGDLMDLNRIDEIAMDHRVSVAFFRDPEELQKGASAATSGSCGIAPFQLY